MNQQKPARLALDEMSSPTIVLTLRDRKHDVVAVAERVDLRSMTDEDLFAWATAEERRLLTENVKDFRPIMLQALEAGTPVAGLLFTSSRSLPRTRQNLGPLVEAIEAWLLAGPPGPPLTEDWLLNGQRTAAASARTGRVRRKAIRVSVFVGQRPRHANNAATITGDPLRLTVGRRRTQSRDR